MKFRLPDSSRNWISLTGAMIATISFFIIVFLFTLVLMLDQESSYVGLVIFIILPGLFGSRIITHSYRHDQLS